MFPCENLREKVIEDSAEEEFFAEPDQNTFDGEKPDQFASRNAGGACDQRGEGKICKRYEQKRHAPEQIFERDAPECKTIRKELRCDREQKRRDKKAGDRRFQKG